MGNKLSLPRAPGLGVEDQHILAGDRPKESHLETTSGADNPNKIPSTGPNDDNATDAELGVDPDMDAEDQETRLPAKEPKSEVHDGVSDQHNERARADSLVPADPKQGPTNTSAEAPEALNRASEQTKLENGETQEEQKAHEEEEQKEPTELMDLPPELLLEIVEHSVGTGADIRMQSSLIGGRRAMLADHSYGGMYFSTYMALRQVNKTLSEMAGQGFYGQNNFEAGDFAILNSAFRRGLGKFVGQLRTITIARVTGNVKKAWQNLIRIKNLQRLTFGNFQAYVYARGEREGYFEGRVREKMQEVLNATATDLLIPLRRHHGKKGIKIVFDGNRGGLWDEYEETVRRANLMGKTNVVALSPEKVAAKVKELDDEFNEMVVAKENEYLEQELASAKRLLDVAQFRVNELIKYMGDSEATRD
ncbi:hypothetical protein BU16DRAFT_532437 [Lophium mytilinum]|uniref:Uncharacterized protein n=1 Tax=Lophium mytilinum TaxID=390894 RepID=A0A6A6RCA5_9PEZI|nr:hypothetical protein BU16DRAFT_532437 [Lophium mytilinum]